MISLSQNAGKQANEWMTLQIVRLVIRNYCVNVSRKGDMLPPHALRRPLHGRPTATSGMLLQILQFFLFLSSTTLWKMVTENVNEK